MERSAIIFVFGLPKQVSQAGGIEHPVNFKNCHAPPWSEVPKNFQPI